MAEMYKVGQLVCSTWKLPQWEAYELGIILEVWEDSEWLKASSALSREERITTE